jgi:predicted dithiol-disulfide oxidoreductase (DUF899 family)
MGIEHFVPAARSSQKSRGAVSRNRELIRRFRETEGNDYVSCVHFNDGIDDRRRQLGGWAERPDRQEISSQERRKKNHPATQFKRNLTMTTIEQEHPRVVSEAEWLEHRKRLLAKEKEFTRLGDQLNAEKRQMPWVKVEKEYVFDGPQGKQTLADLFNGRSQLIVYHFMFGPDWEEGCPICSLVADNFDGTIVHLAHRDVTMVIVSRARRSQIEAFKNRMGWRFKWVSSYGNDFNSDYRVSFTNEDIAKGNYYNYGTGGFPREEAGGLSVFYKDAAGDIFHTYSCYARGGEFLISAYSYLDLVPKGRDEEGLPFTMAWIRHHDRYDEPAEPTSR